MFKRKETPEQITNLPLPRARRQSGYTTVEVRTAVDGCGDDCPNFKIESMKLMTTVDPQNPYWVSHRCEHVKECSHLAEALRKKDAGVSSADEEEET